MPQKQAEHLILEMLGLVAMVSVLFLRMSWGIGGFAKEYDYAMSGAVDLTRRCYSLLVYSGRKVTLDYFAMCPWPFGALICSLGREIVD